MAATIARAIGRDTTRTKETHRLGSMESEGQANTFRTFATATIRRDGSGSVSVRRHEGTSFVTLHEFEWGPE